MSGSAPPGGRIAVIEAMRGVASISVACFHFGSNLGSDTTRAILGWGWLGVDVFFVISGFVIPLSLHGRGYRLRDFPAFLARRMIRLEPPYLASILLTIVLWHAATLVPAFSGEAPDYSLAQLGFHLLYLIPFTGYDWLNPNYWSLAYEFVFYIVVGLTFATLGSRGSFLTFAAVVIVAGIFRYLQYRYSLDQQMVLRVVEFGVGLLLMRLATDEGPRAAAANGLWLAACLAYVFGAGGIVIGTTILASAALIHLLREARLGRWAYFIGGISYSLYLTHTIVGGRIVNLGRRFTNNVADEYALMIVALAVSIAFAVVFAYLIETPSRRAARQIG